MFASVIDIGAAVNWRLNGKDKGLPEFKWKNVLAPGMFIIWGLKNSPISIGAGIQYGPQLREIQTNESTLTMQQDNEGETPDPIAVIESSSWRFGLMIAVDIPLFNFHTKE